LQWLFALSRLFLFDLDDLPIACLSGDSFNAKFTTSIFVPIIIVAAMGVGGLISFLTKDTSIMADRQPMRFAEAFSVLGMIFTALYITLAKVVFSFFECPENPSAPATMQKFNEVECGSETHNQGVPAMILGVVLYLVGFYTLNLHAVRIAPSKWMDIKFRTQYRYLFMRWRLESYYWGIVIMSRNLLVAVAAMISTVVVTQLSWCIIVIFFFVTVTALRQPWRHPYLNYFDVISAEVIAITGFCGLIFVSQQDQMILYTRLQEFSSADDANDRLTLFVHLLTGMVCLFAMMFTWLVSWCFRSMLPSVRQKEAQAWSKKVEEINTSLQKVTRSGKAFRQAMAQYLQDGTPYEVQAVKEMVEKLTTDSSSMEAGGRETRSFDEAKRKGSEHGKAARENKPQAETDDADLEEAVKMIAKLEAQLAQFEGKAGPQETPLTVAA